MRMRNSFWAMLVQHEVSDHDEVVASIRQAMLSAIDELSSPDVRALDDMVSNASDITALWHLRDDLTTAIEAEQGEDIARDRLNQITDLFRKY